MKDVSPKERLGPPQPETAWAPASGVSNWRPGAKRDSTKRGGQKGAAISARKRIYRKWQREKKSA